jgi:MutS domain V/MutS domain III
MTSTPSTPDDTYHQRRSAFEAEERRLARISFRFSVVRGGLFLGFLACLAVILVRAGSAFVPGWWIGAGVWLVAFFAVLPAHDRVIAAQRGAGDLRTINEEALDRMARAWDRLPVPKTAAKGTEGPLARDLDLFGRASLFQLLGTAHTPQGKETLAVWLLRPAPPEEIAARQEAVAELAPEVDFRQQIEVRTRPLERVPPDAERFLEWAEGEPWLIPRRGLLWLTRLLPVATVGLLVAAMATDLPLSLVLFFVTVNLGLTYNLRERLEETLNRVSAREGELLRYAEAMEIVVGRPAKAEALRRNAGLLTPEGVPAHRWMDLLHRRVVKADARHSATLHFFLQLLLLWDFHMVWLLERWQRDAGRRVRGWLAALGETEALSALAGLSFDNPDWAFPTVAAENEDRVTARGLGHPLIAAAQRVGNDVEVGPPGTFLLVTGSNMSGKSTLLRAIGINMVLAQAGGPVCAAEMRLPPVEIATSILIEDSLAAGVSFFMAEVLRIQTVVAAADRCAAEGRRLLYLLDEILRGTNSSERQIAVRRVVHHLLRRGAIGAISTHDLQLAEIEELRAASRPVHFRETIHPGGQGPAMTFDYKMRPGVATTVNALKLMELVGLAPED